MRFRAAGVAVLLSGISMTTAQADKPPSVPELVHQGTGISVPFRANGEALEPGSADSVEKLLAGELSADRAARVALLNSRALQAELVEIGISRAEFRQALLPKNPMIEGEVRFGSGAHNPGELILMQDLTSIILIPHRRQAGALGVRAATLRVSNAALQVVADTRAAYFGAQAAERTRALWEKTVTSAQAAADLARRQHEVGNITDLDLENEQASYEQAKIALARSQTDASVARERLNQLMGTWGEQTNWRLEATVPAPPDSDGDLMGLEAMAVAQRLDLAATAAEAQILSAQIPLARFSQFPELRAGVHVEGDAEGNRTTGPAVELAIPLFDRGQHTVTRTKAQLRQTQDREAALAVSIRSEVRMQRDKLVAARDLAKYYREIVLPRRRRIVEQTQLQFNSMLVGLFQLLQAKQGEVEARRDYIGAQRDYWIARAELERAIGGTLPAAQ